MHKENKLKKKLKNKQEVIGTWSSLSSSNVIDVLGRTSLDFVVIDMEHGAMSNETVENMVRAAEANSISPIIRVSDNDEQIILKALETDVQSILVPHISSADEAKRVVKYSKYFPEGERGLSPYTRVHNFSHENLDKSLAITNEEMFVGILVEGVTGISNLEEISQVKGIDLIYLGLFDICQSVGLPGEMSHPKVLNEIIKCQKIISSNGISAGAMSTDLDYIKMLRENDYKFIAYLNDAAAIKKHFTEILAILQN